MPGVGTQIRAKLVPSLSTESPLSKSYVPPYTHSSKLVVGFGQGRARRRLKLREAKTRAGWRLFPRKKFRGEARGEQSVAGANWLECGRQAGLYSPPL